MTPSKKLSLDNKNKNQDFCFVLCSFIRTFAHRMEQTIIEDNIFEFESFEEDGYVLMAAEHGYRVYILPNPRSCRTADFIFEKKGILGLYDLKTVHAKGSVGTQLLDSIGQTNRVLLNMTTDYNARLLASEIKAYFESNQDALEVLIFKGKKVLPVNRIQVQSPDFNRVFRKRYEK